MISVSVIHTTPGRSDDVVLSARHFHTIRVRRVPTIRLCAESSLTDGGGGPLSVAVLCWGQGAQAPPNLAQPPHQMISCLILDSWTQ